MAVEKNTTYRVAWTDYEGRACRVDIIDLETVSPLIRMLEPGQNPFVSKMDDDEDPLKPLRSGSGTISVVDNYEVMKLFDMTSGHRYRVVVYRSDIVVWQGWLKGESLSQDYESAMSEFSLGCVDDIEALGCWDMTQKDENINGYAFEATMGLKNVWRILAECFAHVNGMGGTPPLTFEFPIDGGEDLWQLKAMVSRGVFFESVTFDDDEEEEDKKRFFDSKTCKEALETICTSFGWSCQAIGSRIVFSTPRVSGEYFVTTMEGLYTGVLEGTRKTIGEVAPTSMGSHEVSQYPGVHKINVRAKIKKNTELLPSLEDVMDFVKDEGTVERGLTVRAITYKSNSGKVVLQGYKMTTTKEAPKLPTDYDIAPKEYGASEYFTFTREAKWEDTYIREGDLIVGLTKVDSYTPDDKKKNYDFKVGYAFSFFPPVYRDAFNPNALMPLIYQVKDCPMVTLRGDQVALSGGALILNANIGSMGNKPYEESWLIFNLYVSVRIGNYYYDKFDKTWVPKKIIFATTMEESEGAKIDDDKTLEMPYNGASGMIMPIDRMLSGVVELCLYPTQLKSDYIDLSYRRIIVYGLSLKHQDEDTTLAKDLPDHYNYTKYLEHWQDETKTVSVEMHSMRDGQNGLGQLYVSGSGGELSAVEKIDGKRPEQTLLNRYVDIFGRVRQMVTVTAKQDDEMRPNRVWTDASGKKWVPLSATTVNWRTGVGEYLFVD